MALFAAIREDFETVMKKAVPEAEMKMARLLMARDGYGADVFPLEPVCGVPGLQPYYCTVGDKKAVCYDVMPDGGMMPLSAYYAERVREAIDLAAEVGALIDQKKPGNEQAAQPDAVGS